MVLPQQQARNPPSIREASEDKQIHRFLHRSNEKVRNLTRFTCNPMESDAEKEEIERGYRNYLPLHHQIRKIDATNKKTGKGKGIRVCTKSTRIRQRRGSLDDWRCRAPPASRVPAQAREQGAQCPRPYPLDRRGAPAGLHGNGEEASARPRAAAARPTRPCMVAARIRWPHPRIHRLRQQLGVVPAPSGTRALPPHRARIFVGQGRRRWSRGRGRRRWLGPAMKTKGGEGWAHLRWGGQGEEKKGRWGGGGSEVRLERGGEEGEVGFGRGEGNIYLMIDAP